MQNIDHFPFSIIILLVIGYTLSLPIKDFKDISGDKKDGVYTIPVLFGENIAKIIIGSGIFISFILSTIILNEKQLLLWAMLFGGISFWLIVKMKKDRKNSLINYRNIFWWMLAVVFIYLIILAKVIFF